MFYAWMRTRHPPGGGRQGRQQQASLFVLDLSGPERDGNSGGNEFFSFWYGLPSQRLVVAEEKQQRHDDIDKLKVAELKETLRGIGLKVSGLKNDLQIRLKHYMDNPDAIANDARGPAAKERTVAERAACEDHILEDVQLEKMEDENHILEQSQ